MTAWANRSSGFENQQNQHFERNKHQLAIPTEIIASIKKIKYYCATGFSNPLVYYSNVSIQAGLRLSMVSCINDTQSGIPGTLVASQSAAEMLLQLQKQWVKKE